NDAATETATIPANASVTFDQANAGSLPGGFVGSAVVTSDRNVGATFNVSDPVNNQFSSSNGFKDGATIANLPVVYNNYSSLGWTTSFTIQNVDAVSTNLTVSFSDNTVKNYPNLAPGQSALFYQPNDGIVNGFNGGVTVTSSAAKIV